MYMSFKIFGELKSLLAMCSFFSPCLSEVSSSVPLQVIVFLLRIQTDIGWFKSYEFLSHSVSIIPLTFHPLP